MVGWTDELDAVFRPVGNNSQGSSKNIVDSDKAQIIADIVSKFSDNLNQPGNVKLS